MLKRNPLNACTILHFIELWQEFCHSMNPAGRTAPKPACIHPAWTRPIPAENPIDNKAGFRYPDWSRLPISFVGFIRGGLAGQRDKVLIASKVLPENLAPGKLIAACEGSLKRLRMDYMH